MPANIETPQQLAERLTNAMGRKAANQSLTESALFALHCDPVDENLHNYYTQAAAFALVMDEPRRVRR